MFKSFPTRAAAEAFVKGLEPRDLKAASQSPGRRLGSAAVPQGHTPKRRRTLSTAANDEADDRGAFVVRFDGGARCVGCCRGGAPGLLGLSNPTAALASTLTQLAWAPPLSVPRGNPGPSGSGALVLLPGGRVVAAQCSHWLGECHTNNEAEYDALIAGLQLASQVREARRIVVEGGAWFPGAVRDFSQDQAP